MAFTAAERVQQTMQVLGGFAWTYRFKLEGLENVSQDLNLINLNKIDPNVSVLATKIPSKKLNTTKVPFGAYEVNVPTNIVYPDNLSWSVTFLADNYGSLRNIFEEWQNDLYDFQTAEGNPTTLNKYNLKLTLGNPKKTSTYAERINDVLDKIKKDSLTSDEVKNMITSSKSISTSKLKRIYDNLASTHSQKTELQGLLNNQSPSTENFSAQQVYTLYGCFPVLLDAIQYSAETRSNVKFNVTLAFQYFTIG